MAWTTKSLDQIERELKQLEILKVRISKMLICIGLTVFIAALAFAKQLIEVITIASVLAVAIAIVLLNTTVKYYKEVKIS